MADPMEFQPAFTFQPFAYGGMELKESTHIQGTPYFTRRAIGEWLEYKNPQKAIDNISERCPHIENPEWATTLKLRAVEGRRQVKREVHIYNPIGLQLIVFESRQPKAIQYKIAVARLVNDLLTGEYRRGLLRSFLGCGKP